VLGASKQVRSVASATEPHAWLSARTRVVESRQEGRTVVTIGIDTHKATLAVHYVFGSMLLKLQAASRAGATGGSS